MNILNKLKVVENFLVKDLLLLEKGHSNIFSELFIGRNKEVDRFVSFVDELFKEHGLNLLISAEAGVGKTHYIANLLLNPELQRNDIFYINLDYGELSNQNLENFLFVFIDNMLKYFEAINEPLNDINQDNFDEINSNLRKIYQHFEYCNDNKHTNKTWKHLIIILGACRINPSQTHN